MNTLVNEIDSVLEKQENEAILCGVVNCGL